MVRAKQALATAVARLVSARKDGRQLPVGTLLVKGSFERKVWVPCDAEWRANLMVAYGVVKRRNQPRPQPPQEADMKPFRTRKHVVALAVLERSHFERCLEELARVDADLERDFLPALDTALRVRTEYDQQPDLSLLAKRLRLTQASAAYLVDERAAGRLERMIPRDPSPEEILKASKLLEQFGFELDEWRAHEAGAEATAADDGHIIAQLAVPPKEDVAAKITPEDRAMARDVERLYRGRTRDRIGLHGRGAAVNWHPAPAEERAMRFVDRIAPTKATSRRDKPGATWSPPDFCTRRLIAAVALTEPEHFQFCLKAMDEKHAKGDKWLLGDLDERMARGDGCSWWHKSAEDFAQMVEDRAAGRVLECMRREVTEADIKSAWRHIEDLRTKIARVEAAEFEEESRLADLGS